MEPLSSFSADGILDDDLRHESVEGRGHRRELGVVAALALHRVQLQVQLVTWDDGNIFYQARSKPVKC